MDHQGRPSTADLYAAPSAPTLIAKAQCPPWSKDYVKPLKRTKRTGRRGRGRGRGRALPKLRKEWNEQPQSPTRWGPNLQAALQDLKQAALRHSPEKSRTQPRLRRAAQTYDTQGKQAHIQQRQRKAGAQTGDYWDKMLHPAQREANDIMRDIRAERMAKTSPKEALLASAKKQLAALNDPKLKSILTGLVDELEHSPPRSLRPPPLEPLRPDALPRAPAGMTPGGFRTPHTTIAKEKPSPKVSFDLSPVKSAHNASFSRAVAPPVGSDTVGPAWDWGAWNDGTQTPAHARALSPLGVHTPAAPLRGPGTPAALSPGDPPPPITWGAPQFGDSDDDDEDDMWWPAPQKVGRPRSVRFAPTVTETPAGDEFDVQVDDFRSFLLALDNERARQKAGLDQCAARRGP